MTACFSAARDLICSVLVAIRHLLLDSRDRKSTRLNSSHSQISYAVFCLKKKKNKLALDLHSTRSSYNATLLPQLTMLAKSTTTSGAKRRNRLTTIIKDSFTYE